MEKRQKRTLAEPPGVTESFNSCICLSKNKNNYFMAFASLTSQIDNFGLE